jgi:phosphatidate phosphatase APP1
MDIGLNTTAPKLSFKERLLQWLRLTDKTIIKVYHGFGHAKQLTIYGHVLKFGPLPRKRYSKNTITNTLALLRLFMVKPYPNATVQMNWKGTLCTAKTDNDGFFKLQWEAGPDLKHGWHDVVVDMTNSDGTVINSGKGGVYVPYSTQYAFVSDIDDTFLISHSANLRKRLFVLFTENARSRKPFDGSVKHYQLLAQSNTTPDQPNPFFYVSSSEWNLYDYILEFTRVNKLPEGVFLLNVLKQFQEIFKTGQNNHQTKFTRIVRILQAYPHQRFILLGDSSQHDPYIYASLVEHFPKQIHAVYIRDVYEKNKQKVAEVLLKIESKGVPCCFFKHSDEAILHSKKIGLINIKEEA